MTSAEIRQIFLDFFASKGHTIVASAPIVVKNDPTLMFTNAGMNQFKDYFLGNKTATDKRVVDTQKCLRVSGKHNDLEEVGVDTYHHTMFEMLGNWSFGDYFKKEAIAWSWELLTDVYKLDKDRLYVTIFEGDKKEGLPKDEEAYNEWKKVIAEDRILLGNKKDNFWEMGDTGPCGPCTEIHVDCRSDDERKKEDGSKLVNADHPQVIEIWNNVFIQYNRKKDGSLESLPAKHVDTGMGFERLVRVIQNKQSNYDTDVFTETIAATEKITGKKYNLDFSGSENPPSGGRGTSPSPFMEKGRDEVAFRVIADHIRAICFTIADGQLPSNTGAGYVIRRILRRAVRYYYSYLDYKQPLLYQLVPVIGIQFKTVFPELNNQLDFVTKVVKEEEESFLRTLEKGLKRIDDIIISPSTTTTTTMKGDEVFELYDTYGFPIDLTKLIATEKNILVDETGFEAEMQKQKDRSRAATAVDTEDWVVFESGVANTFLGYDTSKLEFTTGLLRYRKIVSKNKAGYQFVLHNTPFYAESGGQVGDTGWLKFGDEEIEVINTKKENDLILHITEKRPAVIATTVTAIVDASKRLNITYNHTATHLLHAALRQVLGKHVSQKGSLVSPDILRFDFSHFSKMTDDEIKEVEMLVNKKIRENIPVVIKEMPKEEAMKLGAMALFGEKYGDIVRVVVADPNYSVELCGGTHVGHTGEIGFFKIKHETSIAAGVRRIEAVSGAKAEAYIHETFNQLNSVSEALKSPKDLLKSVNDLIGNRQELQKLKEQLEKIQARSAIDRLVLKMETIDSVKFYHDIILGVDQGVLKRVYSDLQIKDSSEKAVTLLISEYEGKANVFLGCSQKYTAFDCNKIIKENISGLINGSGGGQKFQAMASGDDTGKFDSIISAVKKMLI